MASAQTSPLTMVVSVVVTCAVAAAGLAATYSVTADRIAAQERQAVEKGLAEVIPGEGVTFEPVSADVLAQCETAAGETPVYAVYAAKSGGQTVGWGVQCGPRGYGGPIRLIIGLDRDGKVTGVKVVSHGETPGLGTKVVASAEYLAKYTGLSAAEVASGKAKVDAITGATKSSRGVRKGVTAAGEVYEQVLAKEGGAQ